MRQQTATWLVVAVLICEQAAAAAGRLWCGHQPEWTLSHKTISYLDNMVEDTKPLNAKTGIFQAPGSGFYTVTITAVVGGMIPSKPGDLLMDTSPVYGQIFLKHNGMMRVDGSLGDKKIEETHYLLVKEGEVAQITTKVYL